MDATVCVVNRQRLLGTWAAVIGLAVVGVADLFWTGPVRWGLTGTGFIAVLLGAWWTLSLAPAIVVWFPGGQPTVYRDPAADYREWPAIDRWLSPAAELDRAMLRAALWAEMGWWRATWSWVWARPRWRVLVKIAAARVIRLTDAGIPFSIAKQEEARWLKRTVTAFMLERRTDDCEHALDEALHGSLFVP